MSYVRLLFLFLKGLWRIMRPFVTSLCVFFFFGVLFFEDFGISYPLVFGRKGGGDFCISCVRLLLILLFVFLLLTILFSCLIVKNYILF